MNSPMTVASIPMLPSITRLLRDSPAAGGRSAAGSMLSLPGGDRWGVFDPYNHRLKLYGVRPGCLDPGSTGLPLYVAAEDTRLFSKILVYAADGSESEWRRLGFTKEGVISGFYPDRTPAHIWSLMTSPERWSAPGEAQHDRTLTLAAAKSRIEPELPPGYQSLRANASDAAAIARLMKDTFAEYPTPITAERIANLITKKSNHFRWIRNPAGRMAAVASGEIDHRNRCAEMTDCATRPEERGRGLMACLLAHIESDLLELYNIDDLYTLARADEIGMNCVFGKLGYKYTGRLVNNCRMPNGWESMNIWCKTGERRGV
ncbi:hypothetical protein JW905_06270 [bacterium]|nr:hypothetical protein [candidate division CSSED10-310 bacterium]